MKNESLHTQWQKDEKASFQGWDFTYLEGRWEEEPLPWDYKAIIQRYLEPHHALLDMGTGGGEFVLSLGHPHEKITVTEMWEPNVKLCQRTLTPLGITVHQVFEDSALPIPDNSFDIIINRHESYDPSEVRRILKPDGIFITQQVGGQNNVALSKQVIDGFQPLYGHWCLDYALRELGYQGFTITNQGEYFPYLRFMDVGALAYYAKVIEWEFPDFSVDRCYDQLYALHKTLEDRPYIKSREHRFILVAKVNK